MNGLTGADVYAKDQLFATLDTRTRRWQLPGWGPVLLSDTVGFIRDLPHHLVASFKATLEETRQADLLLHVADASNPHALEQITAVYKVLEELGIQAKDTLLVLNKVDRRARTAARSIKLAGTRIRNAVPISARAGDGLPQLAKAVSDALSRNFRDVDIETDVGNGRHAGLSVGARRSAVAAVPRRSRRDPLPLAARASRPDRGRSRPDDSSASERAATASSKP